MSTSRDKPSARQVALGMVRALRQGGHVAYLAGGCVRDELLGLAPKDYDVATDAPPERVREIFRGSRSVGEAFGVVLVRQGGQQVEVATFRTEWGYEDGRRPGQVHFTDARHDAQRRDFTINGLFAEEEDNHQDTKAQEAEEVTEKKSQREPGPRIGGLRVIDFVGGVEDLQRGVIRAIGRAEDRFAEDHLRMLRAVRFAARLGFVVEAETAQAIRTHAAKLSLISRERIGQELRWMFGAEVEQNHEGTKARSVDDKGGGARKQEKKRGSAQEPEEGGAGGPDWCGAFGAARLMQALGLDGPALQEEHGGAPLPTLEALEMPSLSWLVPLAAWLIDRHAPAGAILGPDLLAPCAARVRHWRKALCLSNEETEDLKGMIAVLGEILRWPALGVARRKRLMGELVWRAAWALMQAMSHRPGAVALAQQVEREARALLAQGDIAPEPFVTGDDLIALGARPGPGFKQILDEAYDRQLDGRFLSRPQALAWLSGQIQQD